MTPSKPDVWGLDGDILCYSVGFASEDDPLSFAITSVKSAVQNILRATGAREGIVYLTGEDNYRKEWDFSAHPYKGNRKDSKKPRHLDGIREYMIEHMDAVVAQGQEADDLLGIACTQQDHGIATLDKDLNGIAGWHYCWTGKREGIYYVNQEQADQFFYTQLLTGDSTDNIPGLFKMTGAKAMQKIKDPLYDMVNPADMYEYVREVYIESAEKNGILTDEIEDAVDGWLLKIGRLLWIRRTENELWSPPSSSQ